MKYILTAFSTCGVFFLIQASNARAQNTTTSNVSTYGELSALTSQIAILKAQAEIAGLQQQINQTKRTTLDPSEQRSSVSSSSQVETNNNLPRILAISGRGKQLSALLLTPDGEEVEVKPGTPLEGGIVVQSLSTDAVYITQNGYFIALPFAGVGVSNSTYAPGG